MIIDCHGHYTTEPKDLHRFRKDQTAAANAKDKAAMPPRAGLKMSDDEIRESIEGNQLKLQRERGTDLTIFSPRASWMEHHVGNAHTSRFWTEHTNDLVHRVTKLYPESFIGVCALPQSPGADLASSVAELDRCVNQFGFIGCNLNLDPSGGHWNSPPLGDRYWYPIYEKMVELDVPAMIHGSATQDPQSHMNACHYTNVDANAVVDYCLHPELWELFPGLKIIVPHGGGATAFNYTRMRSIFINEGRKPFEECVANLWFDLAIYDEEALEMTIRKLGAEHVMYATEMWGSAYNVDPLRGKPFDETMDYVNNISWLTPEQRYNVLEGNARKVFSRAKFD